MKQLITWILSAGKQSTAPSSTTAASNPPSLAFCLVMDAIGYLSFAIPMLGEVSDLLWAPISGYLFYRSFGGWKGSVGGIFAFVEEMLPGLDFVPTFTLMWLWQRYTKTNRVINIKSPSA